MKKQNIIAIILLFIIALTALRLGWVWKYQTAHDSLIEKGILDLRHSNFNEDEVVLLKGEWLFFPSEFLTSDEIREKAEGNTVMVPGNWEKGFPKDEQFPKGFGTYHLRILLPDAEQQAFRMYAKQIKVAANVFVNGELKSSRGKIAENDILAISDYRPMDIWLEPVDGEIDLTIQVANFSSNKSGGITENILFGKEEAIGTAKTKTVATQFIAAAILLLHSIYALGVYVLFSRQKALLYLSLATFFGGLSILFDDDRTIMYIMEVNGYEWLIKLNLMMYVMALFFAFYFIRSIFPEVWGRVRFGKMINPIICMYMTTLLLLIILAERSVYKFPMAIFMLGIPILIVIIVFKAFGDRRERGYIYLLLGATAVGLSALWGIIKTNFSLVYPYYPFDILIGIAMLTMFFVNQFFRTSNENERLVIRLQKMDKQKDDFLSNTSHELRNPLHGIIHISEAVYEAEKKSISDESRRNLKIVQTLGRRMSYILDDLLDLTKLKENRIELQLKDVSISAVVLSIFDTLNHLAANKNIELSLSIPEQTPYVEADENRLFQILYNLIHNALKFTVEGKITVTADWDGSFVNIHVIDTGIGIDEEVQQSIFLPYYQADPSTTSIGGGIGLGLSICDQLVQLHGGTISVQSTLGKGSTFTFSLPKGSGKTEQTQQFPIIQPMQEMKQTTNAIDRKRILVIDDDPLNLEIIERLLQSEGYFVKTCPNGKAALEQLNGTVWDLILSDIMMPSMSGYELTEKIRKRYSITELPILLITAKSQMEDMQIGFACGANDYVTKPVDKRELLMRVKLLIDLKSSVNDQVRLEAAWLQAQIQPHFLFNTLNAIAALSEVDLPKMMRLLDEFGNYLNSSFIFQNVNKEVPLKKEIELVKSYLFIEQARFDDRLIANFNINVQSKVNIPPLSLQTIVENAVRHGVLKRPEGGTVTITILEKENYVIIEVEDDGVGMSDKQITNLFVEEKPGKGIGLMNTNKRLKQLYGKGLFIKSIEGIGTSVSFVIPIKG
ncbi:ATP-binding protein [Sporosarcina sp. USHLN248]|uniref:ATP-binding protein n=1 Tax=Sporosarcina sp. USHLN248 TaxID=3081300 RepID=UPI003018FBC1